MKRLLIAYDGSHASDDAIHDLAQAALPPELDVKVISVADVYLPPSLQSGAAGTDMPSPLVRKAEEKALREVEAYRALATRACGRIQALFPKWKCMPVAAADSPGWAIIRQAAEFNADLVVLGSQSHSGLERLFLGSVAHKVAAEAPCSVRIGRQGGESGELRIMVAVDGSADSKAALRAVAARCWPAGTQFRVVTVIDPRLETAITWPEFLPENFVQTNDASGREWISRMMESASRILFDAGLDVANFLYDGHPKDVLVQAGHEWNASALFLGARGLHHGDRLYVGTVAASVASRASCSVEIVRPKPIRH